MSFPVLISAVPFWAIDYEPPEGSASSNRLASSDGGLCLNFPIDMFDRFVPKWPTFGIALQRRSEIGRKSGKQTVWLPKRHSEGQAYVWNDSTDSARSPLGRFGGFIVGCATAAWRWNDITMMTMPGVRDRVVRVLLEEHEGGMNFNMRGSEILTLARRYGKEAAKEFVERFEKNGGGRSTVGCVSTACS